MAASDAEKEKVIDAFVGEFLLPTDDVRAAWSSAAQAEPYSRLVRIAAEYRLSWSSTIASAGRADVIDRRDIQGLRARTPTRGDFLEIVGYEPLADLIPGTTGPGWKRAVFGAWRNGGISAERAVQLVQNTLTVGDLPQLEVFDKQ